MPPIFGAMPDECCVAPTVKTPRRNVYCLLTGMYITRAHIYTVRRAPQTQKTNLKFDVDAI